jgi:hypothetical protein
MARVREFYVVDETVDLEVEVLNVLTDQLMPVDQVIRQCR